MWNRSYIGGGRQEIVGLSPTLRKHWVGEWPGHRELALCPQHSLTSSSVTRRLEACYGQYGGEGSPSDPRREIHLNEAFSEEMKLVGQAPSLPRSRRRLWWPQFSGLTPSGTTIPHKHKTVNTRWSLVNSTFFITKSENTIFFVRIFFLIRYYGYVLAENDT